MRKIIQGFSCIIFLVCHIAFAGGGLTHMYIAERSIPLLQDRDLQKILYLFKNDYLTGAYYPDSGYINGVGYGEDSHWDEFVFSFCDYLKEKYASPLVQNPRLVAFLFGVASHRVSDEIMHQVLFKEISRRDFNGDDKLGHQYGDVGIDLVLNFEKNEWNSYPKTWAIPVNDLVKVYKRIGRHYSSKDIIYANAILKFAGHGEWLLTAPAYPVLQWKMPWTARNYMTTSYGGLNVNIYKVAEYQNKLWKRLTSNSQKISLLTHKRRVNQIHADLPIFELAYQAVTSGIVIMPVNYSDDGYVSIGEPIVQQASKLEALIRNYMLTMAGW